MPQVLTFMAATVGGLLLWVHLVSRREHEPIAARRSLLAALVLPLPFLVVAWLPVPGATALAWVLITLLLLPLIVFLVPTGQPQGFANDQPDRFVDERTIMFSRAVLEPGTPRFEDYYRQFPAHRDSDDKFRALPGLMSPAAGKYEQLSFTAAAASFTAVEELAGQCEGEPAAAQEAVDPTTVTSFIKGWTRKLGALDCGVTTLQPHHLYTIKGRGEQYGQPVDLPHKYAIAFTVEMDHRNLGAAPEGPTLMESAQQYLNAGAIAVQVATFIRKLGWPAEAHIDAHYKVICPLVAKDAGLGEIGRMGLLMTPRQGPRVRLGVVTTDLPLELDQGTFDPAVLHFCTICRKCADQCPVDAINTGPRAVINGAERWQIDAESCFSYWCATGTDCGQCMRVCPYSHPDNALHNLVRWGLRRSSLFRHAALRMDDLLYGRRPAPLTLASWLPRRQRRGGYSGTQ